jgi:hypothetical protein
LTSVSCASPRNLTVLPSLKNEERLAGQRILFADPGVLRLRNSLGFLVNVVAQLARENGQYWRKVTCHASQITGQIPRSTFFQG